MMRHGKKHRRGSDVRGGDAVSVGSRLALVVKVQRQSDHGGGRRIYLVRYKDTGEEARVSRSAITNPPEVKR